MIDLGERVSARDFAVAMMSAESLEMPRSAYDRIEFERAEITNAVIDGAPIYGLNTGLGANLEHRLTPEKISDLQIPLLAGRAAATGKPLPEPIGRGMLLSRLHSVAIGGPALSQNLIAHLMAVYEAGFAPVVPEFGSIGAGDLTQNASWAMALLGYGEIWVDGVRTPADDALDEFEIPQLEPKDAMGLMNHSGLTVARAAAAIAEAHLMMDIAQMTAMLSCAGYGANRDIFDPDVNKQRDEPGQVYAARWFAKVLDGPWPRPRRIQEALSFRTIASIIGTAQEAVERADLVWEDEAFGISDSPVMLEDGRLRSTANFQSPALALELEKVGMALAMVANASVQRMQKLMSPELSKLPRYLSPRGSEAAGMVPLQKTAAALLSDIRRHAMPVIFDPAPVSQSVEDMAPMTPQAAGKLTNLCDTLSTLLACEAMVAAQAIDLHGRLEWPDEVLALHGAIREAVPKLIHDRPVGPDVSAIETILLQRA